VHGAQAQFFDEVLGLAKCNYDKIILFLDYDGTLREFEHEPMAAIPSE